MGETVREAVIECEALLDGLLMLARSEAGVERRSPVDLAAAARRSVDLAAGADVDVTLAADGPVLVDGDPALLARMVANLVENAVGHNEPGGWATVQVRSVHGWAEIVVTNSGTPVPAAAAARLLEPFQRLARHGDGGPGAGLGLSIVRTVAEAHGGEVALAPRPGGGLCVAVRLPRGGPTSPGRRAPGSRGAGADGGSRPLAASRS
jgi:signal transduction histidine kinase